MIRFWAVCFVAYVVPLLFAAHVIAEEVKSFKLNEDGKVIMTIEKTEKDIDTGEVITTFRKENVVSADKDKLIAQYQAQINYYQGLIDKVQAAK